MENDRRASRAVQIVAHLDLFEQAGGERCVVLSLFLLFSACRLLGIFVYKHGSCGPFSIVSGPVDFCSLHGRAALPIRTWLSWCDECE